MARTLPFAVIDLIEKIVSRLLAKGTRLPEIEQFGNNPAFLIKIGLRSRRERFEEFKRSAAIVLIFQTCESHSRFFKVEPQETTG